MGVDLLDFDLAVGQVVVEDVELVAAVEALVLPQNIEAQHLSVVVQEALQSLVGSASLQLDLDVVLELSLIGWSLLEVDHGSGLGEQVLWIALGSVEWLVLVGIELPGEVVAVDDAEYSVVDVEVDSDVQVSPGVVLRLVFGVGQLMSLQEGSLWDARVLNLGLINVDGVVFEEVVDDALAGSEVLVGVLDDWLDEEGVENELLQMELVSINLKFWN